MVLSKVIKEYITNGTPRTIKLGNRSITFKKGTPRYFAYQSRVFTMVVTALKEIGEDKVSDEVILKIKSVLDTEEKEKVNHDYRKLYLLKDCFFVVKL